MERIATRPEQSDREEEGCVMYSDGKKPENAIKEFGWGYFAECTSIISDLQIWKNNRKKPPKRNQNGA